MENLQNLEPALQALWPRWQQLTLDNVDYAAVLVVSVWLLTAIFYSIRLSFSKKTLARAIAAGNTLQANLENAEAQNQSLQQQLTETTAQFSEAQQAAAAESERASALEQRLQAVNAKLADSVAQLAERFELNVPNLPGAQAENLLSEYSAVVARVAERFHSEQQAKTQLQLTLHAEVAKVAEKEMLATSLQHRLDTQTQELAKLEMAIERYEAAQRQFEAEKAQWQAAQVQEQQQAEALRLAELERQQTEILRAAELEKQRQQLEAQRAVQARQAAIDLQSPVEPVKQPEIVEVSAPVPPVVVKPEPTPEPVVVEAPIVETPVVTTAPIVEKPVVKASAATVETKAAKAAAPAKAKGFFGRTIEKFAKMDEKLGFQAQPKVQLEEAAIEPAQAAEPQPVAPVSAAPQPEVVSAKPAADQKDAGIGKKMGGLLGGFKKSPAEKPAEQTQAPAAAPEPVEAAIPPASAAKPANTITGLFGKLKGKK